MKKVPRLFLDGLYSSAITDKFLANKIMADFSTALLETDINNVQRKQDGTKFSSIKICCLQVAAYKRCKIRK